MLAPLIGDLGIDQALTFPKEKQEQLFLDWVKKDGQERERNAVKEPKDRRKQLVEHLLSIREEQFLRISYLKNSSLQG